MKKRKEIKEFKEKNGERVLSQLYKSVPVQFRKEASEHLDFSGRTARSWT